MSKIKKLNTTVSNKLQSQSFIVSFVNIILELIRNSIDANATNLQILINFTNLKCIVTDNGHGMIPDDLVNCGKQHFTSKLEQLNDLYGSSKYGFKGESVFHISNVSHLTIISKGQGFNSYWIKKLGGLEAKNNDIKQYDLNCPNEKWFSSLKDKWNTCFIVNDILYNLPIRRKIILETPSFQQIIQIKKELLPILIRHPQLQIVIKYKFSSDDSNDWKYILNYSSKSVDQKKETYSQLVRILFGPVIPLNMMKKITIKFKDYSLTGILSRFAMKNKDMQFIILNDRFYCDLSLFNSINNIFQDAVNEDSYKMVYKSSSKQYPIFLLSITAPKNVDDILKDPSKSVINPSDNSLINNLVIKVVKSFFRPETIKKKHKISVLSDNEMSTTFSDKNLTEFSLPVMERKIPGKFLVATKIRSSNFYSNVNFGVNNNCNGKNKKAVKARNTMKACSIISKDKWKMINSNLTRKLNQQLNNNNSVLLTQSKINNCWLDIKRLSESSESFKLDENMIDLNITREQLSKCSVINQIDKKFILLSQETNKDNSLFIMDQHACDERIKLEHYLQQFINNSINGTLFSQKLIDCKVPVNTEELNSLKYYVDEFKHWGITYNTTSEEQLKICTIPDILLNQFTNNDKMYLRNALLQHVYDLNELKKIKVSRLTTEKLMNTHIDFVWWKYLNCIPNFFLDLFASKACRSAIMFGDTLNKTECEILIKSLIKCHSPFQCAHGRPSVIPLTIIQNKTNETNNEFDNIPIDYQLN